MRRVVILFGGLCVAFVLSANAVAHRAAVHKSPPLQHVTIFGDSEAAALSWDAQARVPIEKANRVTYELHACGRLTTPGCVSPPPPSTLSRIRVLGNTIGPTAIILVGYNDDPHVYKDGIDEVLRALHRRGVKQVLWLTLRALNEQYRATNEVIRGASHRWPFMTVVNWASYSAPHSNWFVSDGIHFTGAGAVEFGKYLHNTLKGYGLTGPEPSPGG